MNNENIALKHKEKNLLDKDSIFHFLFGSLLGVALGGIIQSLFITLIIGAILIPTIEYGLHIIKSIGK